MKTVEIYVNNRYFYKTGEEFTAVAHWDRGWLNQNGNLLEKEGHIEIYNIGKIMEWSKASPSIILHEMTHCFQWRHGVRGSKID